MPRSQQQSQATDYVTFEKPLIVVAEEPKLDFWDKKPSDLFKSSLISMKKSRSPSVLFELDSKDLVIVRPRKAPALQAAPNINIPSWAEDKAREIAREKGWDFHVLKSNWIAFAQSESTNGNAPKNTGAAFVGYCKTQKALR